MSVNRRAISSCIIQLVKRQILSDTFLHVEFLCRDETVEKIV